MTTSDIYPYLIIVGSSILVAAAWLLHQYRTQIQRTQELIHLNEQLGYDLPDFLRQCWPMMKKSGFSGMSWQLDWFGTQLAAENGMRGRQLLEKKFAVHEITLTIQLYRHRKGWEQQHLDRKSVV